MHRYLTGANEMGESRLVNRVHYFFEVQISSPIFNEPNEDINEARWFTRKEIQQLPLLTNKIYPHLDDFEKCKVAKSLLPIEFVITSSFENS